MYLIFAFALARAQVNVHLETGNFGYNVYQFEVKASCEEFRQSSQSHVAACIIQAAQRGVTACNRDKRERERECEEGEG